MAGTTGGLLRDSSDFFTFAPGGRRHCPGLRRLVAAVVALLALPALHGRAYPVDDCFVAGTQILMADGTLLPIEQVREGQAVKSPNLETRQLEDRVVLRVTTRYHSGVADDYTIRVSFANGTVNQNTNTEPYYVQGKGWASYLPRLTQERYGLAVAQLEVGDTVYAYTGAGIETTLGDGNRGGAERRADLQPGGDRR